MEHSTVLNICETLPVYAPFSSGSYADLALLTLESARQCFPFLQHLVSKFGRPHLTLLEVKDFAAHPCVSGSFYDAAVSLKLKALLDGHGSDKATRHNYHLIYGPLLRDTTAISGILEIGLGTNDTNLVSNMGASGIPGASLKAFRDFLPNAAVYGADVDKRILFEDERICTYFVDQTDLSSFDELETRVPRNLDLVIDDGLHSPNANIAVLIFGLGKLKEGGWVIIEDIRVDAIPVWHVVAALLPDRYECFLLKAESTWVFAVKQHEASRASIKHV